jgi:hypothetical protein
MRQLQVLQEYPVHTERGKGGILGNPARTPSHLLKGVAVHGSSGQDAVDLAQPFPLLADGLVRRPLGCAKDPVDLSFEVSGSACEKMLIRSHRLKLTDRRGRKGGGRARLRKQK